MVRLLAIALFLASTGALAQTAKGPREWRSCSDGDRACQAFCDQKGGSPSCTSDCSKRGKECRVEGFFPWGADGKNSIGPLAKD